MKNRTKILPIAIVALLVSLVAPQFQSVNAGGKSPLESGHEHGCDDGGISNVNNRYIKQPEKGPSFHTDEFMRGYNDGYDECSNDDDSDSSESSDEPARDFGGDNNGQSNGGGRIDWEQLCIKYGERIGISSGSCDQYAHGTQLTQEGKDFLVCNLITRVGPTLLTSSIGGLGSAGVGGILGKLC